MGSLAWHPPTVAGDGVHRHRHRHVPERGPAVLIILTISEQVVEQDAAPEIDPAPMVPASPPSVITVVEIVGIIGLAHLF